MTVISVADACRRLGIDAKTLHRWLHEAQLPLHTYPGDGRKKGVSHEHLEHLAHLHQRRLPPSPQPPALVLGDAFPLPATLLALPETICALQAQIAALQASVADLTHFLEHHARLLTLPAPAAKPPRAPRRPPEPTSPASRARPTPKPSRKPAHVIPRVEYGPEGRYVVICPRRGLLPLEPDTPEWFAWVAKQSSFRFVGKQGHFTAHHEWRVPRGAWRAHRHIRNHLYAVRLAPNQELTLAVLERAAEVLQAHLM